MGLLLAIVLLVLAVATLPRWGYNVTQGYAPSVVLGLLLVVVLALMIVGRIPYDRLSW